MPWFRLVVLRSVPEAPDPREPEAALDGRARGSGSLAEIQEDMIETGMQAKCAICRRYFLYIAANIFIYARSFFIYVDIHILLLFADSNRNLLISYFKKLMTLPALLLHSFSSVFI